VVGVCGQGNGPVALPSEKSLGTIFKGDWVRLDGEDDLGLAGWFEMQTAHPLAIRQYQLQCFGCFVMQMA
jgi:hypothetical protein